MTIPGTDMTLKKVFVVMAIVVVTMIIMKKVNEKRAASGKAAIV